MTAMDNRVREGILAVRATGRTNMFLIPAVQRIAMELGYYETVIWINENRSAYCRFIMTGEEPADKPDEQEDLP